MSLHVATITYLFFSVLNTTEIVYYNDGGNVTLEVGIDPDPVKLICQQMDSTVNQGFFASFSPCGKSSNQTFLPLLNISEEYCGANCLAYVIRPTTVGCVELMCQRGTNSSSTLTETCYMQVHIQESSTPPTRIYNSRLTHCACSLYHNLMVL